MPDDLMIIQHGRRVGELITQAQSPDKGGVHAGVHQLESRTRGPQAARVRSLITSPLGSIVERQINCHDH